MSDLQKPVRLIVNGVSVIVGRIAEDNSAETQPLAGDLCILSRLTVGQALRIAYGDEARQIDVAVPRGWAQDATKQGVDPQKYVWDYRDTDGQPSIFGRPLAMEEVLKHARATILAAMAQ